MKVTRRELAQLIKEELDGLLSEYTVWDAPEGELDKYFGSDMLAGELASLRPAEPLSGHLHTLRIITIPRASGAKVIQQ